MKILVISNYYPPHYIGGYELACFDTVEFLKHKGHDVKVLTGNYKSNTSDNDIYRQLRYINYYTPSYKDKYDVEQYNFDITKELIQTVDPDIIYIWSLRLLSLAPVWAVEKSNIKKIFEIGDFWMKGFLNNELLSKIKRGIKNILPISNSTAVDISPVICVSKWMAHTMQKEYNSKQIHIIPNGTKVNKKQNIEKEQNIMRYMFCGRIDYSKGLDLAIKALASLKDNNIHDFEFHIYGDGDKHYLDRCLKMVKILKLESCVFYHGKKDNLEEEYLKNHVLIMPTRMQEPFGLVIIEAMNYGVVTIAPDAYGPKEILTNGINGLLFTQEDQEELDLKVKLVHNNWSLINKLKINGYKKVQTKYNLNIVKDQVEQILLDEIKDKQ